MKKIILVILIVLLHSSIKSQTNDFKIGIFGFDFMSDTKYDCSNVNYKPITTTTKLYNNTPYPSSKGNVLSADGFNIVANYQPDIYNSSITFMSALLDLVKNNNLQFYTDERFYYKPNIGSIGVNLYQDEGDINVGNCKARPNYDELYANVYSNLNYKNVVWGHHITEEASYNHTFNPTTNFGGTLETEVPPSNVSNAIGHFKEKEKALGIDNQKLVVMEANHGRAMWEGAIEDSYLNSPNNYSFIDYLKFPGISEPNKPDVFMEGSYFPFPETNWVNTVYFNMLTNYYNSNYHYLGGFKSIDWAYTKVDNVHKVIDLEVGSNYRESHFHSNSTIKNANWLWFQAYTSIIHKAKGIWFWGLDDYMDGCEVRDILFQNNLTQLNEDSIINEALKDTHIKDKYSRNDITCTSNIIIPGTSPVKYI